MTTPSEGQTPVEELIGWEWRCVEDGFAHVKWGWARRNPVYGEPDQWVRPNMPPAEWVAAGDHAEVDDLAGWLRGQTAPGGQKWWPEFRPTWPNPGWEVELTNSGHGLYFGGPTILAALEAAVRAVHDEGAKR